MQRKIAIVLGVVLMLLMVVGCAAGPNEARKVMSLVEHPAGFLLGFWHGLISPIAFVVSLFNNNVGVYEINNVGHWYDLGFLLGAASIFGSGTKTVACNKKK